MPDPIRDLSQLTRTLLRLPIEAQALATLVTSGLVGPERPDKLIAIYQALERYGAVGAAASVAAIRYGTRPALVDELGTLTYADLDRRSNALANAMRARGVKAGSGVGILCRNHRGIYDAGNAALKLGARALYLNTDFAGPQAAEVAARGGVDAIVYDEEFSDTVAALEAPNGRYIAWSDGLRASEPTLESLIAGGNSEPPPPSASQGTVIILTSGTTGIPKGANRSQPRSLVAPAAILSKIPFRSRDTAYICSPVYHAWGLGVSVLMLAMGSTIVVRRRFDPEAVLVSVAEHRCSALVLVPVMLNRLLAIQDERNAGLDLSSLRIIASSGAQLEASLATRAMDRFGDIVYNLYGSTEVAWATIATPEDLRSAPGTAGRPPLGTTVRIYDDADNPLPAGEVGRIFVGSGMEFGGYTGGGTKQIVDGLMSTGDVGHFDESGRLFVDGRDDEMIVSGGENVYPREVEELLSRHESIFEAAAIGVADADFGQRLRVFVVKNPGHAIDEAAIKEYVRLNLARYKVPREVVFVDQLPRNPSGKVLKRELATLELHE
ncbi:MAG TPA: acyl-CoA synthetase [Acidimicrobiales bacterium]|nr:acyl-CoA synthetase [Acidimicrobiales bacterium]